jgi:8-oxo-dGTP diphosphatase
MIAIPQFGAPQPGRAYPDRPAAFGVALRDGRLAIARITLSGGAVVYDLPGGGIDPGEGPAQAMVREFGEEVGLRVAAGAELTRADQYFNNPEGAAFNVRGVFFTATVLAEPPGLKIEDDHERVWLDPVEALKSVRREAHAWAISVWLRSQAGRVGSA